MRRTKFPYTKKKKKTGPKSSCTQEVIDLAYKYALLGATKDQIAHFLGKDKSTIGHWERTQPDFEYAIKRGREEADANVAQGLYLRAIGYTHESEEIKTRTRTTKHPDGTEESWTEFVRLPTKKHYPPDTKAATKWLALRRPDKWQETQFHQHNHQHLLQADVQVHYLMEQISDTQEFTEEELKLAAKLGLNKAVSQNEQEEQKMLNGNN